MSGATQIPTLWIHKSGRRGRGGALILDRCRAFDLFASVDAHLCQYSFSGNICFEISVFCLCSAQLLSFIFLPFTRPHCKGRASNINVWFPFMYSHKWNCYFQNRIIMFCLPVPPLIYLWEIYIFPGSVCLFCCREICGQILGIYESLTDTWMWKLGLRPCNSQKRNT